MDIYLLSQPDKGPYCAYPSHTGSLRGNTAEFECSDEFFEAALILAVYHVLEKNERQIQYVKLMYSSYFKNELTEKVTLTAVFWQ